MARIDYVPMMGPLPGAQYVPSNSAEGVAFIDAWCTHCARDRALNEGADFDECEDDERCEIVAASFRGQAVEWRCLSGGELACLAFVDVGTEPQQRCERTLDMFGLPW